MDEPGGGGVKFGRGDLEVKGTHRRDNSRTLLILWGGEGGWLVGKSHDGVPDLGAYDHPVKVNDCPEMTGWLDRR